MGDEVGCSLKLTFLWIVGAETDLGGSSDFNSASWRSAFSENIIRNIIYWIISDDPPDILDGIVQLEQVSGDHFN